MKLVDITIIFILSSPFIPVNKNRELTEEEKLKVDTLQADQTYYKKWQKIAEEISKDKEYRRTELQVKNYWNSKTRSQDRSSERIRAKMGLRYILRK